MEFFSGKKKDLFKYLSLISCGVKGKIICVDLDNTLVDTNYEIKKKGFSVSCFPNPCLDHDFWRSDLGKKILSDAKPLKNTIRIVESMKSMGADIIFATSRPVETTEVTAQWMKKYIEPIWGKSSILFKNNKISLRADIYFEDNPDEILEMLKAGATVFAPKYHYNSIFESRRIIYYNTYIYGQIGVNTVAN